MLDHTRAALDKTVADFKRFILGYNVVLQLIYIAYLIYALIAPSGILAANIALLSVSVAYFIFYLATYDRNEKQIKKVKKTTKRAYKWFKLTVKAFTLAVTIYGIYMAMQDVTVLSVILAAFSTVGWALQVILELAFMFVSSRIDLIMTGVKMDTKPVQAVGDFVKKVVTGQDPEPEKPTRFHRLLEKTVFKKKAAADAAKEKEKLREKEEEMLKRREEIEKELKEIREKANML